MFIKKSLSQKNRTTLAQEFSQFKKNTIQSFFVVGNYTSVAGENTERWAKIDIDSVRKIKHSAAFKRDKNEEKIFVLDVGGLTREAEAALLKLLEEPPSNTYFVLEAKSRDAISPILRSRLVEIADDQSDSENKKSQRGAEKKELFSKNPITKSKALEGIADRGELKVVIDNLENDARSLQTSPEEYFARVASISKIRNFNIRPATPIAMIKDYLAFLLK